MSDAVSEVMKVTGGGAHGVLMTAVSPTAFSQAISISRRNATLNLVGLRPEQFATPIFEVVWKRITFRRSIAGSREAGLSS
ncbi:zinc-binding dehydrogenase [Rhizobium jaguaris]|uniref:zinc-binding dehydrogenase n=1 Tax=Rhizobium jaguaris TaxID=1312183 RepID=UPI0039BF0958